jgi:hypothetical protein
MKALEDFSQNNGGIGGIGDIACCDQEATYPVRKTSLPDVYVIYKDGVDEVAIVPDMVSSKLMRNVFKDKRVGDTICMSCVFNQNFGKWQPLLRTPKRV